MNEKKLNPLNGNENENFLFQSHFHFHIMNDRIRSTAII